MEISISSEYIYKMALDFNQRIIIYILAFINIDICDDSHFYRAVALSWKQERDSSCHSQRIIHLPERSADLQSRSTFSHHQQDQHIPEIGLGLLWLTRGHSAEVV